MAKGEAPTQRKEIKMNSFGEPEERWLRDAAATDLALPVVPGAEGSPSAAILASRSSDELPVSLLGGPRGVCFIRLEKMGGWADFLLACGAD
ncbi:GM16031 [Drosophila sechellia]|uniref:GM16031 n=1 Tax=Drosophila sechellia TaxID=7238 RepID=B4I8Q9_DROSE|nr:GM16031 [Drosophila sechellia]